MALDNDFEVVVIGAGIAGSTLALALAREGITVALVEARPLSRANLPAQRAVDTFDQRVSALTPASVAFLGELGAWQHVRAYRECAYRHMTVWDAEGTGRIDFDSSELRVPALGHIVENRVVCDALLAQLDLAPGVRRFTPARLEHCERGPDGRMRLRLDGGEQLVASLLVGADGALSRVREMLSFTTREWDYGHRAIVGTVRVARHHEDTAWQRFLPSGPLALLPLPGTDDAHFCSIVWSIEDELADPLLAMQGPEFCRALSEASEYCLGEVLETGARAAFPLRQRHAVDYVQPGAALVGDSAHTIHPLAGQGINLGLADVAVLAEELVAAHRRGLSPGRLEVLRRYQRRRKGDNLVMMAAMEGFKRLFEQKSLPLRWLRNAGIRGVNRMAPLKHRIMTHAMGIGS